jgi:hypothetical protein
MNLLSDILTYIRRIIKSPSNAQITDDLLIDYVNRFWLLDVDARMQLFDFKTKYQFQTTPGLDQYNMPLYSLQVQTPGTQPQNIASFPVYQGFLDPAFVNGIQVPFYSSHANFWNLWPNYIQQLQPVAIGNGSQTTFTFSIPYFPAIPGHLDITGIIQNTSGIGEVIDPIFATSFNVTSNGTINLPTTSIYPGIFIAYVNGDGSNTVITDSGVFLSSGTTGQLYGLLMQSGNPPFGNKALDPNSATGGTYSETVNTVNYSTGVVNVTFPIDNPPPAGVNIQAQCYFYEQGIPRAVLFNNNTLTLRPPPQTQYLVELDAYLTPAAFLTTASAFAFGYMTEYIARGAARKILSDTGDVEQFQFYEPLFREQENLVWKRSQRQFTNTRTGTIFSESQGQTNYNNIGAGTN